MSDKVGVSRFIDNAVEILEAAETAMMGGQTPSQLTILIGTSGGIRMVADSDWPLESLQREHGARMAYRVVPGADRVSVEGREGSRTCHLESPMPTSVVKSLLNSVPYWHALAQ